ncbi:unnamed protein product [Nyctereutes procyonoides]|uniref:(raccoon dog) hypothetical protein n=1 Tax=Nyctereutes procyonoides TaxID=34880 RepID=A0A811Z1K6_NYCPR|nr:unnamed protein product [Nyctereutes procyonoides]
MFKSLGNGRQEGMKTKREEHSLSRNAGGGGGGRRLPNSRGSAVRGDNASTQQPRPGAARGPRPQPAGRPSPRAGAGARPRRPGHAEQRRVQTRSPAAGPGAEEAAHLSELPGRARREPTCGRRPERPRQLLPTAPQSAGHPAQEPSSEGGRQGRLQGGRGAGRERRGAAGSSENRGSVVRPPAAASRGSGRHAEVRLHLGDGAAAEPRGSASTSRGSLLTLHREEAAAAAAAAEEAAPSPAPAQSPAAAEWPPASPQDPPPRLRRAAHRARRAQHGQLRQPHAAVRSGSGGGGGRGAPVCTGRPAGRPGQAGGGERSPVPVWRSLPSTPTRLPLHAGGAAVPAASAAAAAAAAAEARAAAAAALAGRGHVTQPAGSLGAGKRAHAEEARLGRARGAERRGEGV